MSNPLNTKRRMYRILAGGCVLAAMTFAALLIMGFRTGYWRWRISPPEMTGDWKWQNPWPDILGLFRIRSEIGCTLRREQADIRSLGTQLQMFEIKAGRFPTQAEGIRVMVKESLVDGRRITRLLDSEPVDPWGRPYQYRMPALRSKDGYDLFSLGPDGVMSQDDIGNWE